MDINSNVAVVFYWTPLRRSVRIEGSVTKLSREASEEYFHSRPRASQIGAVASPQSKIIPNRQQLDTIEGFVKRDLEDKPVPIPDYWGGYLITPRMIEFWQGQTNRLHDRIRFRMCNEDIEGKSIHRGENGWVYERLAP